MPSLDERRSQFQQYKDDVKSRGKPFLPFVDLRRERRLLRRPVAVIAAVLVVLSMGVLTYKGATAHEALASEVVQAVPSWAEQQGFKDNKDAVAGAVVFASSGCTACHT